MKRLVKKLRKIEAVDAFALSTALQHPSLHAKADVLIKKAKDAEIKGIITAIYYPNDTTNPKKYRTKAKELLSLCKHIRRTIPLRRTLHNLDEEPLHKD
jgi:hypothetical protein